MSKVQVTIKNVDAAAFTELKAEAAREKMAVGDALSLAIMNWVADSRKPRLKFASWKTIKGGKKTRHVSEYVDNLLYG